MQKIIPSLWFDRNCEEAINFYVDTFKNAPRAKGESKIELIKYYPSGITEGPMAGFDGKVLTGIFWLAGQKFMALDGGPVFKPPGPVSMYVECEDQEEVDYFWSKLKEGGAPEAQVCGWLADKYGFSWQIIPKIMGELLMSSDKAVADYAMQAMLKMKKIEINKLQKTHE